MTRWTEADIAAARSRVAEHNHPAAAKPPKYRNEKIRWHGMAFDSKLELKRYREFELQCSLGAIRAVVRQVSLPLLGTNRRIRVDFLIVENDGRQRWFDAKGHESAVSKLKRDQVRQTYGIEIELC